MKSVFKIFLVALFMFSTLGAKSQNKQETLFEFFDGETEYSLVKTYAEQKGELSSSICVVPDFNFKKWVLDKPIIDTIRDPDDPSIILALDTVMNTQFHYAKGLPLTYDVLKAQVQLTEDNASDQGLKIAYIAYMLTDRAGKNKVLWELPTEDEVANTQRICITFVLHKNRDVMRYGLLFE